MTDTHFEHETGLTLAAEIDALGLGGYGIMKESYGSVSARELLVFRGAIVARQHQQTNGEEEHVYEPDPDLSEDMRDKLRHAHMVGSTVADILLSEQAIKLSGNWA
jgi:hypothetical protein